MNVNDEPQAIVVAKVRKKTMQLKGQPLPDHGMDTLSKDHINIGAAVAAIIGIWGIAALITAIYSSVGPLNLAKQWFTAVTGL